jgi:hypothetical protein
MRLSHQFVDLINDNDASIFDQLPNELIEVHKFEYFLCILLVQRASKVFYLDGFDVTLSIFLCALREADEFV